jgi:hypothetical protein
MPKKGKEPAGLRRYRLAKRKRTGKTRTVRAKPRRKAYTMARRRRSYGRKKGRKSKPSVSLLALAPAYPVIVGVYNKVQVGDFERIPHAIVHQATGISLDGAPWDKAVAMRQVGLAIGGIVGHKMANKLGVNRYLKKATMGWITL